MKKIQELCIVFALLILGHRANAQWAVAVVADPFRQIRWIQEDIYWDMQISNLEETNSQLMEANTQLEEANVTLADSLYVLKDIDRRIGEPASGSAIAYSGSTGARSSSNDYIRRALSLETVMGDDDGKATLLTTNHTTKAAIGTKFTLDGSTYDRDPDRYRVIEQEEKLREAFKTAVKDFHDVQKKELEFQESTSAAMTSGALTVSEIQARTAAIEASRGRVDLAKNRMELARAELDAFTGQIDFEERKIAAARWEVKDKAKEVATNQNDAVKTFVSGEETDDEYDF